MSRGTVTLPSRSYPAVPAQQTPGLPNAVPGGVAGPAPIPSRLTTRVMPPNPAHLVPGGRVGQVVLFRPAVDKQAPYFLGGNEGFSIRSVEGRPLAWLRRFFTNDAALRAFLPANTATPDWTSNHVRGQTTAASSIPVSRKPIRYGALRRAAYQDEQLFNQLTDRRHPWPIQKPVPFHLRAQLRGQPVMTNPYWPRLTRYTPAASYSQTTKSLLSAALTNLLPQQYATGNPNQAGGSPYGSY